ncbi:MAG: endonuclease MutS2 [Cyclobacteriaceae bacterium]|jgi:DNA mismatch repair protein MutS2
MLYPSNLEEKIGFDKIKQAIRKKCTGEFGQSYVDNIKFSSDFELIRKLLNQTDEFVRILQSGLSFPGGEYYNIRKHLVKASKIDSYLSDEEFHELKLTLSKTEDLLKFFKKHHDKFEHLTLLTVGIYLNPQLLYSINKVIDESGKIRNSASDELIKIRSKIQELEFKVRAKLERILKKFIKDGYSSEEVNITIRNGRLVIPVRAEYKRVTGGFIHDESASGQTAFIEPSSLVELNNDIRDSYYKEKREIIRILIALTDLIRPEVDNLRKCYEFVGIMDFIKAKALYAIELNAILPELVNTAKIEWLQARHPILYLSHQASGKPVIPLDITLTHENRILVISGPNAGGKSVCLQTVGLIQFMLQCGLLVPLLEGSKTGIFQRIFIDIGDEQSLENDLSTYSSHLMNMNSFLKFATKKTLFLIDEFGTGTEPQFGGAIAEAILRELSKKRSFGIITTHYTNLKKFAEKTPGIINGAMRFDITKMEPLFELHIGKPGSSFALEIAGKIGLPNEIIQYAKQGIGTSHVNFERLLGELEEEKKAFEVQKRKLSEKESKYSQLVKEYDLLKGDLEKNRNKAIKDARQEANDIISKANKEIEKTIRLIKEAKADKEKTRKLRRNLEEFKERIKPSEPPVKKVISKKAGIKVIEGNIEPGDFVRIVDQGSVGQVLNIKRNTAEVAIGDLKSNIKLSRLERISKKEYGYQGRGSKNSSKIISSDLNEKLKFFETTLDLRGKRAEEALTILNHYLDEALLLSMNEVRILHGKGDGILRDVIRAHLSQIDYIDSVYDEDVDRGGSGISVVHLK